MATVILVRHGRSTANTAGVLAGRTEGVTLDETGLAQVKDVGERLASVALRLAVSSPLERCRETADAVLAAQRTPLPLEVDDRLTECDYGTWQGRKISDLAKEPLWRTVQEHPSHAVFPDGESLQAMAARVVAGIRALDARVEEEHGPQAVWLAVSHGDLVKAVLADAHGTHLDHFQRIIVDPASVSIVRYTAHRPYVVATNTHAGDLSWLEQAERVESTAAAVPGGGAGPTATSDAT